MAEAGGAIIGALRVILGADTADFDKGLKNAQSGMSSFVSSMASIASGMALEKVLENFVSSAVNSVKHAFLLGDELNKMSQKAGVSVDELSKLRYAAELADVPTETLGKSMGKLSKTLVSAATDAAGPAANAFRDMGVKIQESNGAIRPTSDILGDIAEKFSGYKDGAEKTALAIALFGKAGAEMIPLLNLGKEGLQEASDEAKKFGLVLDKQTAMQMESFQDNLKRLQKISEGIAVTIASRLVGSFDEFTAALVKSKSESTLWITVGEAIASILNKIVASVTLVIGVWQQLFATAANLKTAFDQLKTGDVSGAFETMKKSASDTVAAVADLGSSVRQIAFPTDAEKAWKDQSVAVRTLNFEVNELGKTWSLTNAPRVAEVNAQKDALDRFLSSQIKKTAAMQAEAQTVGQSAAQQVYLRTVYEAQAVALANNIPLTAALNTQIMQAGQNAANAANMIAAANVAQQVRTPAEKFRDELAELQVMYETTNMTAETFARRQQQLAEGVGATWNIATAQMAGGFSQLAQQFAKSSKEMALVAKVAGIIEATINTYTAFTKALASAPPPYNYVMAAGVLAAGMAKVAAIKSQNFKTGGSFMVRGGGGADSVSVPMNLSPGERVDVWRPGEGPDPRMGAQGTSMGVSAPSTKTIVFDAGSQQVFTLDTMKQFIDGLNDAIDFGYKIKLKATN